MLGGEYSLSNNQPRSNSYVVCVRGDHWGNGEELGWRGSSYPGYRPASARSLLRLCRHSLGSLASPLWFIPEASGRRAFLIGFRHCNDLFFVSLYLGGKHTDGSMLMAFIIHFIMNFASNFVAMLGLIPSTSFTYSLPCSIRSTRRSSFSFSSLLWSRVAPTWWLCKAKGVSD